MNLLQLYTSSNQLKVLYIFLRGRLFKYIRVILEAVLDGGLTGLEKKFMSVFFTSLKNLINPKKDGKTIL